MVVIGLPNDRHLEAAQLAAAAGKAVLCTKPLGRSADEARAMLVAVERAGVFNGYLEDLVYTPKTLKALQSVAAGSIGKVLWARSREAHGGPHSAWFWDRARSGGGAIVDLGCHCIEIARRFIGSDVRPLEVACGEGNAMLKLRAECDASGAPSVERDGPAASPAGRSGSSWLRTVERSPGGRRTGAGAAWGAGPEGAVDGHRSSRTQSLGFDTERGLVILTGCGDAGVVTTRRTPARACARRPFDALIGGAQLSPSTTSGSTGRRTSCARPASRTSWARTVPGSKRSIASAPGPGSSRGNAVVGAVGASFELGKGLAPGAIAR